MPYCQIIVVVHWRSLRVENWIIVTAQYYSGLVEGPANLALSDLPRLLEESLPNYLCHIYSMFAHILHYKHMQHHKLCIVYFTFFTNPIVWTPGSVIFPSWESNISIFNFTQFRRSPKLFVMWSDFCFDEQNVLSILTYIK